MHYFLNINSPFYIVNHMYYVGLLIVDTSVYVLDIVRR